MAYFYIKAVIYPRVFFFFLADTHVKEETENLSINSAYLQLHMLVIVLIALYCTGEEAKNLTALFQLSMCLQAL